MKPLLFFLSLTLSAVSGVLPSAGPSTYPVSLTGLDASCPTSTLPTTSVPAPRGLGLLGFGKKAGKNKNGEDTTIHETTSTHHATTTAGATTPTETQTQEDSAAAVAANTDTHKTRSPSGTASEAAQSSSACPNGSFKKSKLYHLIVDPTHFTNHLKVFNQNAKDSRFKCANKIIFTDNASKGATYYYAVLNQDGKDVVQKKAGGLKKLEEEKKTDIGPHDPKRSFENSTEFSLPPNGYSTSGKVSTVRSPSLISRIFRRGLHSTNETSLWNLNRISIDQTSPLPDPLPNRYKYPESAGNNVDIYILDYSIGSPLPSLLQGRITDWLIGPFSRRPRVREDPHGAWVAYIAGMVAKRANIISVKALPVDESIEADELMKQLKDNLGNLNIVTSLTRIRERYLPGPNPDRPARRAVVNLSLSVADDHGPIQTEIERLVKWYFVPVVHSAGNKGRDACKADTDNGLVRGLGHFTVGATTSRDVVSQFSNYGDCVDIYAPGEDIELPNLGESSLISKRDDELVKKKGTSLATPHVTAAVAMLLAEHPKWTPEQVYNALMDACGSAWEYRTGKWRPLLQLTKLFP